MPRKDIFCWFCQLSSKLNCNKCGRNFHLTCLKLSKPNLSKDTNGPKKFVTVCPICISAEDEAKKWTSGEYFEPLSRSNLNYLLDYTFQLIKKDAPEPFLWPLNRFRSVANPLDVTKIEEKFKNNHYDSPRAFLNDVNLINHNCMVIFRNSSRLFIDKAVIKSMGEYNIILKKFRDEIEKKIWYLEDCPHCILNFIQSSENWLTMACPWGHPLIIEVKNDDEMIRPAKLLRHNRASGRVDILLFESCERTRVKSDECWIPSSSDLASNTKDNPQLAKAKSQARKYIETMEKKFKRKIRFGKERRKLANSDKDYIQKHPPAEYVEDVIELTDDESVVSDNNAKSVEELTNEVSLNQSNGDTDGEKSEGDKHDENMSDISDSATGDEVIDEVYEKDEPSPVAQNNVIPGLDTSLLTTVIERVSLPFNGQIQNDINSVQTPVSIPMTTPNSTLPSSSSTKKSTPIPARSISTSTPTPKTLTVVRSTSDKSVSATTSASSTAAATPKTSTAVRSAAPTQVKLTALNQAPVAATPPLTPLFTNQEQFIIVSDEEFDTQTNENDSKTVEDEPMPNFMESIPAPMFVVEDGVNLNPQYQPISPDRLSLIHEDSRDTMFETASNQAYHHRASSSSTSPVEKSGFNEFHQSKKLKLDHEIFNTSRSFEIKRLQQQLEFSEKEKQLNLQQITEVQEQLRLSKQMEETKMKTIEVQYQSQIKILEDSMEKEIKLKNECNTKLLKSLEEITGLIRKEEETKLFWQNKLTNELKAKDDHHSKEMDIQKKEIAALKVKLEESENRNKVLNQKYNKLNSKFKRLSATLITFTRDTDDDDDEKVDSNPN